MTPPARAHRRATTQHAATVTSRLADAQLTADLGDGELLVAQHPDGLELELAGRSLGSSVRSSLVVYTLNPGSPILGEVQIGDQLEWITRQAAVRGDLAGAVRGALFLRHLSPALRRWG